MSEPISTDKLEAIRAGAAKATPGPWIAREMSRHGDVRGYFVQAPDVNGYAYGAELLGEDEYRDIDGREPGIVRWKADASLIAACDPDTITSLVSELLASRSTIEALRRERDEALGQATLARQNFHTMQNAANELRLGLEAAERELALVKEGGWKVVPVEPTEAMIEAGGRASNDAVACSGDYDTCAYCARYPNHRAPGGDSCADSAAAAYRAMLAAAPLPPAPTHGEQE